MQHGPHRVGQALVRDFLRDDVLEQIGQVGFAFQQCQFEPAQHAQVFGDALQFPALRARPPDDRRAKLPPHHAGYTQGRPLAVGKLINTGQDQPVQAGGQIELRQRRRVVGINAAVLQVVQQLRNIEGVPLGALGDPPHQLSRAQRSASRKTAPA